MLEMIHCMQVVVFEWSCLSVRSNDMLSLIHSSCIYDNNNGCDAILYWLVCSLTHTANKIEIDLQTKSAIHTLERAQSHWILCVFSSASFLLYSFQWPSLSESTLFLIATLSPLFAILSALHPIYWRL